MRRIAFLFLLFPFALSAQEDCQLFNIQDLAAENLALHDSIAQFSVDTIILQPDGTYDIQLSNGSSFAMIPGCTDPNFTEYSALHNVEDGSCLTPVVLGCTAPNNALYNPLAHVDDGSCSPSCVDVAMDGYTYDVVLIGDQCWFADNLRTTVYSNGDGIPQVLGNWDWDALNYGARCVYGNNSSNVPLYGRMYNWFAVDDARGLCPSDWHVPTDAEWSELEDYIASEGFSGVEATALKSTTGWSGGGNGTDVFGFEAPPGGNRTCSGGLFGGAGSHGRWWTSTPNGSNAWARTMYNSLPDIWRVDYCPESGWSVRCLRDGE